MTNRTRTHYEWDIEWFDIHGDIIEHHFEDRLAELKIPFSRPTEQGEFKRIVLVRDTCEEVIWDDGFVNHDVRHREWFYPSNLEGEGWVMLDVPKRYAAEFKRNVEWASKATE